MSEVGDRAAYLSLAAPSLPLSHSQHDAVLFIVPEADVTISRGDYRVTLAQHSHA